MWDVCKSAARVVRRMGRRRKIAATSRNPFPRRGARRIRDWGTLRVLEQTGNVTCWFLNRDLKPCNVLVVPKGRGQEVKLLDFGFALIVNDGRLQMADVAALSATSRQRFCWGPRQARLQICLPLASSRAR